ncbi:2-dehydropantoate 2-reductase [invertebrate metagenome]|uniref:2-dehydropantoate 2-reductase n=1 Tax=invertebrate metagenome TaxID=1711999 RepID=A0A484H5W0_9ZZZZ
MKIAIYGSGGVGSYYGARLAAAGAEVWFIARGVHYEAIRVKGLRLRSGNGDLHIHTARVTDDPAAIGPVDVVIVTVKLYDTTTVAEGCKPLIGSQTFVVSFQNGVTAADILKAAVGAESVWGGTTYIMSEVVEPGVVVHTGTNARLVFGALDGSLTPSLQAFHTICTKANIDAVLSTKILTDIWSKFSFLAPLSGMTALTRCSIGRIRSDSETRAMFQQAVEEVVAVARAKGVALKDDIVAHNMKQADNLPGTVGSSQLYDLIHGKRLELPWLSGTVSVLGHELGIPTPVHSFILAGLKFHVDGSPH